MASYDEIKDYVYEKYGFVPKSCWIADMKDACGIPVRMSAQRKSPEQRNYPCPQGKRQAIEDAFRHFHMIDE